MIDTLRSILRIMRFILLEVIPFATWAYQRMSRGATEVYWPYREEP